MIANLSNGKQSDFSIMHTLDTLVGIYERSSKAYDPDLVYQKYNQLLENPSTAVKVGLLRAMSQITPNAPQISLINDQEPHVRLAKLLAQASFRADKHLDLKTEFTNPENLNDRWLREALTCLAAQHYQSFLSIGEAKNPSLDAATLAALLPITSRVAEHVARGKPDLAATMLCSK